MATYKESKKFFINPYNFVSIDKVKPVRSIDDIVDGKELHTGYFECELITMTPIAIPDHEENPSDEHKRYPFFRIADILTIPGSSIRGVIRTVYEAATNSCLSTINSNEHITKRTDIGTYKPCLLIKNGNNWDLYTAKRVPLVGKNGYAYISGDFMRFDISVNRNGEKILKIGGNILYNGSEVEIEKKGPNHKKNGRLVWEQTINKIEPGDGTGAYLFLGESFSRKHAESVFEKESKIELDNNKIKKALEGLESTLDVYRSNAINRNLGTNHYGYIGYERARNNGVIPLWYKYDDEKLYFSMAAIGRMAFYNSLGDLSSSHEPCEGRDKLCPACAIFGLVGNPGKGIGSRVSVEDAIICTTDQTKYVTLKELGTPRTSFLPFYSKGGKDYDDNAASIRGRKFYWHIPNASISNEPYLDNIETKRNGTFEIVNAGNTFSFKIYFNSLTEEERQMLAWAISLGGNDTFYCHKLGHGKPLGLGSVKIKIKSLYEREINSEYILKTIDINDLDLENVTLIDEASTNQLKEILEYKGGSKSVIRYPFIDVDEKMIDITCLKENVAANHQWFKKFKESEKVLPQILDDKKNIGVYELNAVESKDFIKNLKVAPDNKPELLVTIKSIRDNNNGSGKVANAVEDRKMIFDLPKNIKNGDKVKVRLQHNGKHYTFLGKE